MNFLFFVLIIASLVSSFIIKKKNYLLKSLLFIMVFAIVIYPSTCVTSAKAGIDLWIYLVVPSLLPFFMINDMLVSLKIPDSLSKVLARSANLLFATSGFGAYAFIMSIFSGYPTGARIVSNLVSENRISNNEGQKILTFSSTSGPLFIIGVVSAAMLGNANSGYILLLSHITGAILNGIAFSFILGRKKNDYRNVQIGLISSNVNKTTGELLSSAILSSFLSCVYIGGYIILFSVIIALLEQIMFFDTIYSLLILIPLISDNLCKIICSMLEASLEISNGSKILSSLAVSLEAKMMLLSFLISFSGFAVIGQVSSLVYKTKISMKMYIFSKLLHGIFATLICGLLLRLDVFRGSFKTIETFSTRSLNYYSSINHFIHIFFIGAIAFCIFMRRFSRKTNL